jgi:hypothetical protein
LNRYDWNWSEYVMKNFIFPIAVTLGCKRGNKVFRFKIVK